jgi:molybdate transport system regulatory protein
MKSAPSQLEPRLRVSRAGRHLFGPGKAELLHYIVATGSIRTAAGEMRMSYHRTWSLVQEMNALFREPLVVVARGGGTGGGAALTPAGQTVLACYARMEAATLAATRADWAAFQRLLR